MAGKARGAPSPLVEAVKAWQQSRSTSAPEGVWVEALRAAQAAASAFSNKLPEDTRDEIAHEVALECRNELFELAAPEAAVSWVRKKVIWRCTSKIRALKNVDSLEEKDEECSIVAPAATHDAEGDLDDERRKRALRAVIAAGANDDPQVRLVLDVCINGDDIEERARQELEREPRDRHGRERTYKQARDTIDKWIERGKDKLALLICEQLDLERNP